MVVGSYALFRGRNPVFHSKQHIRDNVQQYGYVQG